MKPICDTPEMMRVTVVILLGTCWLACAAVVRAESPATTEPNFIRDVVPVLTKAGCNAGACHGAFSGRGGFRLSLLGFDPDADYDALVRDARGRRVSATAPENSLLLRKAGGLMPHGGGLRMTVDSESHQIVRNWLDHGTPGPDASRLQVTALKVSPADVVLNVTRSVSEGAIQARSANEGGHGQNPSLARRACIQAVWSDGVAQDVTKWALFDSSDNNVAEVTAG